MPLQEVESASPDAKGVQYILFFASGTPSWCPDCREALSAIETVFGGSDAPLLSIIKVGMKEEWKSPKNKWRGGPFHVGETPCIIKLIDVSNACCRLCRVEQCANLSLFFNAFPPKSKEVKRLGDQACKSTLELQKLVSTTS